MKSSKILLYILNFNIWGFISFALVLLSNESVDFGLLTPFLAVIILYLLVQDFIMEVQNEKRNRD